MSLESSTVPITSEREIVSSNQKTTGIRGFLTGCFAYADDEVSGKLVFSGVREGFRSGGLEHFRFSPSHGTLYLFVFAQFRTQTAAHFCWNCTKACRANVCSGFATTTCVKSKT
jgi:hypothetical protein